mgnify:CR=1 FL=1
MGSISRAASVVMGVCVLMAVSMGMGMCVLHSMGMSGLVRGAVVVAEGAQDLSVRTDLLRAAQAVLGVPSSKIEVFPMEGE